MTLSSHRNLVFMAAIAHCLLFSSIQAQVFRPKFPSMLGEHTDRPIQADQRHPGRTTAQRDIESGAIKLSVRQSPVTQSDFLTLLKARAITKNLRPENIPSVRLTARIPYIKDRGYFGRAEHCDLNTNANFLETLALEVRITQNCPGEFHAFDVFIAPPVGLSRQVRTMTISTLGSPDLKFDLQPNDTHVLFIVPKSYNGRRVTIACNRRMRLKWVEVTPLTQ